MTDPQVISVVISAIVTYFVWYYGWRTYHLDNYRDNLFALRDQLFTKGIHGEIPFGSKSYFEMENYINLHLRFAHRFTLLDGLSTYFWPKRIKRQVEAVHLGDAEEWSIGIESDSTREFIYYFEDEVAALTFRFITSYNLLLLLGKCEVRGFAFLIRFLRVEFKLYAEMTKAIKHGIERSILDVLVEFNKSPQALVASYKRA
jgi:hypothetical protein